jgi:AcrR family transcriptional regulator
MVELGANSIGRAPAVCALTRLARVSTATFYAHFDGIEECLVNTYTDLMAQLCERISATRSSGCDRDEQGSRVLRALVEGLSADPAVARLVLIDIFSAGPAAFAPIRANETRLELAICSCLDRREERVPPEAVAWVVAGALHCIRRKTETGSGCLEPEAVDELVEWGQALLAGGSKSQHRVASARGPVTRVERHLIDDQNRAIGSEEDLILGAVIKLARAKGYWALTPSIISKAAGVPVSHFKRCFTSIDHAYLRGVERLAQAFYGNFRRDRSQLDDWSARIAGEVDALARSVAADPTSGRLVFSEILAPGLGGLTRRQVLLDRLAMTWSASTATDDRPPALSASASAAALWAAFARALETDEAEMLPIRAETLASFTLAAGFDMASIS